LDGSRQDDPEQTVIRNIYQLAKAKLEFDASVLGTCSTWFNSGLGPNQAPASAADLIGFFILPHPSLGNVDRFAHADFIRGGTIVSGEFTSAFVGGTNTDRSSIPGVVPNTSVMFNRNGAFFKPFYSLAAANPLQAHMVGTLVVDPTGPVLRPSYIGSLQDAQLVIALHELAHMLHDDAPAPSPGDPDPKQPAVSTVRVPGFQLDGAAVLASVQNTDLIIDKCRVMIERP
jgi:hypothetical protein